MKIQLLNTYRVSSTSLETRLGKRTIVAIIIIWGSSSWWWSAWTVEARREWVDCWSVSLLDVEIHRYFHLMCYRIPHKFSIVGPLRILVVHKPLAVRSERDSLHIFHIQVRQSIRTYCQNLALQILLALCVCPLVTPCSPNDLQPAYIFNLDSQLYSLNLWH